MYSPREGEIPLVCLCCGGRITMEAGRRRGSGRMPRPRTRTPANPQNRAGPPEDDTTIALLRQQQEIMAQMVEQQQRTNRVIELLATRLVQVPAAEARHQPHRDMICLNYRWILSCHHLLPNEHRTREPSQKPRIGVVMATSAAKASNIFRSGYGEPCRILGRI
jgi:hypothetical protein